MRRKIYIAAITLLSTAIIAATAPARAADTPPNPADPTVTIPTPEYRSVFAGYRKAAFDEKADWRQANDAVRNAGGHGGAMKDMPDKQPPDAKPSSPAAPHGSSMGSHGGHR